MPPPVLPERDIPAYVFLSLVLALVVLLTMWRARTVQEKLILLGLIVSVAALGYGSIMSTGAAMAAVLMRIGLIFVLGGIAVGILSCTCGAKAAEGPPAAAPAPQEPRHEP
jgi:uncharacterized protein involved in response to NO